MTAIAAALAGPSGEFRLALEATVAQVREALPGPPGSGVASAVPGSGLGAFAAGRIDAARFVALTRPERAVDAAAAGVMTRALDTLAGLAERAGVPPRVVVPRGGSLRDAVAAALADIGRAFAAARCVEQAKAGGADASRHVGDLDGFPFARWNRSERRRAPPLVVEVDGADLLADGLAEFLDGTMRLVLVVGGRAPPAPLARLVTPGVLVVQSGDTGLARRLAAWDGPGIAALVPPEAARFVHDPRGGPNVWERLTIEHRPEGAPRAAIGAVSVAQQAEQLAHLLALAAAPPAAPPSSAAAPPATAAPDAAADPAGQLASWLLGQADLSDAC